MSCNREHVIWESKDHTWNIGFFNFVHLNEDDPDRDPEWDVEYLYSEFFWARKGFSTPEQAQQAWIGPNPGADYDVLPYNRENAHACKEYDEMVRCLDDPAYAIKKRQKDERAYLREQGKKALEALPGVPRAGERLLVEVSHGTSMKSYIEGRLIQDGKWLSVAPSGELPKRVLNTETGKLWMGRGLGAYYYGVTGLRRI